MESVAPRQEKERALVIGFGNPTRQDDAAGYVIINKLNERLGLPLLDEGTYDDLEMDRPVATLWLQQLMPELADTIATYDLVVFVDAHTGAYKDELRTEVIAPAYHSSFVSHHMKPSTLLAFARDVYHHAPRGILYSVRGYDFDFGTELSARTMELVDQVLDQVWALLNVQAR